MPVLGEERGDSRTLEKRNQFLGPARIWLQAATKVDRSDAAEVVDVAIDPVGWKAR
jgi:hypothetical protein